MGSKPFWSMSNLNCNNPDEFYRFFSSLAWTTDIKWRQESKISEKLGRYGRQNMLQPYLKICDWDWIFGCVVKTNSSLGLRSPCNRPCARTLQCKQVLLHTYQNWTTSFRYNLHGNTYIKRIGNGWISCKSRAAAKCRRLKICMKTTCLHFT